MSKTKIGKIKVQHTRTHARTHVRTHTHIIFQRYFGPRGVVLFLFHCFDDLICLLSLILRQVFALTNSVHGLCVCSFMFISLHEFHSVVWKRCV